MAVDMTPGRGRSYHQSDQPHHTEAAMVGTISRDELKAKMDRGEKFTLVEALGEEYYRRSHIPGAVNIPADRVGELAGRLLPDKNREVITYCMSAL